MVWFGKRAMHATWHEFLWHAGTGNPLSRVSRRNFSFWWVDLRGSTFWRNSSKGMWARLNWSRVMHCASFCACSIALFDKFEPVNKWCYTHAILVGLVCSLLHWLWKFDVHAYNDALTFSYGAEFVKPRGRYFFTLVSRPRGLDILAGLFKTYVSST